MVILQQFWLAQQALDRNNGKARVGCLTAEEEQLRQ